MDEMKIKIMMSKILYMNNKPLEAILMNKYMLTIQHEDQKVAYIEFNDESDDQAKITGENIFRDYARKENFIPRYPVSSGNFTGLKPRIKSHYVSKWIKDINAVNANGFPSGGRWSNILV